MGESDGDRQKVYRDYLLDEWERGEGTMLFHGSDKAIGDKAFLTSLDSQAGRLTARKVGRPRKTKK